MLPINFTHQRLDELFMLSQQSSSLINSFLHLFFQVASGRFADNARLRRTRVPDLGNASVGNAKQLIGKPKWKQHFYHQGMLLLFFKSIR
jgi:hypothetical protein